jgi:two-component system sensor kinase FixL
MARTPKSAPLQDETTLRARLDELERAVQQQDRELAALRALEQEYRVLLEGTSYMFWMSDPDLTQAYYISPAYETVWGRSTQSFYANPRSVFEAMLPGDREHVMATWKRRREGLPVEPTPLEFRIEKPDGTVRWIRGRGFIVARGGPGFDRYLGFAEDITDRKHAEEELRRARDELEVRVEERTEELSLANARLQQEVLEREQAEHSLRRSEELYRLLAEHATDMISKHTLAGEYIYASPACRALLGYEPHELVGRNAYEFFHADDLAAIRKSHESILRLPDTQTVTYRIRRKDGAYTWLESVSKTIRDPSSHEVREIIVVSRDVTQRKRDEEERRRLHDELMHVARLTTLGEMASGLAHELNQPLAAISNYVEAARRMLGEGKGTPPQAARAMAEAAAEAQRAGQIIRHLRSLARRSRTRFSTADINQLVSEVVALTAADFRTSGARPRLLLAPDLPPTLVDRIQIQQVLLNLVRNGLEAMDQTRAQDRVLTISTRSPDDGGTAIEVSVDDAGCGLTEEARSHLFEPFFTTKPDGMGMGLAISRTIVESHEGRLWAEPVADRGTSFRFTLPIRR